VGFNGDSIMNVSMKVVCEGTTKPSAVEDPRSEIGEVKLLLQVRDLSCGQLWSLGELAVGPICGAKLLKPVMAGWVKGFPSAANIIHRSGSSETMPCEIGFTSRNLISSSLLLGVADAVSSSLVKSKVARIGVCTGVSMIDDESQLEQSDEKEEFIDKLEKKGGVEQLGFDPNCTFCSKNILDLDLTREDSGKVVIESIGTIISQISGD
jgi:hypothetical protein